MGLFSVSLHFRDVDEKALAAALKRRRVTEYRLLSSQGGWATLYEQQASQQDDQWIRTLTGELSQELKVAAIAMLVHDSDVACYWLFDNGKLIDEYNSFPSYCDADGPSDEPTGHSGGRPELLLRYCRPGTQPEVLAEILGEETVFAESVIERLAEVLGIAPERALGDYAHADEDDDGELKVFGGLGGREGSAGNLQLLRQGLAGRVAEALGLQPADAGANPDAVALVNAAAEDDVKAIARLLAAGVPVDVEAPAPLPAGQPMAGLGKLFPGGAPKIPMTALLTAISHKRTRAAQALLGAGADPNRVHPFFGNPIHAATAAGEADLLQLIISAGGDVNARNAQGQTALQILTHSRASLERLAHAQAVLESMGHKIPGLFDQLSQLVHPTAGWDRCEALLKQHGAQ